MIRGRKVLNWLARYKYRKEVLEHINDCVLIDLRPFHPEINDIIDGEFQAGTSPPEVAVKIVCMDLLDAIEKKLDATNRAKVGKAILEAYEDDNMVRKFAAEAVIRIKENMRKTGKPVNLDDVQWRIQHALISVCTLHEHKQINDELRAMFFDEVAGALDGQTGA